MGKKYKAEGDLALVAPQTPEVIDSFEMPAAPVVTSSQADTLEFIADDLTQVNGVLRNVRKAWTLAVSVDDVCKLAVTTTKILKDRRELANKPLGAKTAAPGVNGDGYLVPYFPNQSAIRS